MANIRVIHDNAIDRATSLSASGSVVGTLVASNMQNDYKGRVHRSSSLSVTYTATWTAGESVGGVGLLTNLSSDATVRVRGYDATVGGSLLMDSGVVYACAGLNLGMQNWTRSLNGNAFAYGGISKTGVWFDEHYFVKRLVVDVVDIRASPGYVDCARLIAGAYYEPDHNPSFGMEAYPHDTTQNSRNDAGDNVADLGTMHDVMNLDVKQLPEDDRAELMRIMRRGVSNNFFLSVFPGNSNPLVEQDGMIFAKRMNSPVRQDGVEIFSTRITLEGW